MLKGLTGIKIGIAAAIIGIGLIVVVSAFSSAQGKARDERRLSDVSKIQQALKIFFDENGYYPFGGEASEPTGIGNYIDGWPASPSSKACPETYFYRQNSQGEGYELEFCLEQGAKGWGFGVYKINQATPL